MRSLIPALFFLCSALSSFGQLTGRVVSIADGDTFRMLVGKQQVRVRLHGVDCPEKAQDFSIAAKDLLSKLIFNKTVTVTKKDVDQYGRIIAIVNVGSINVNEELLRKGLAWHYTYYDKNPTWKVLEAQAKAKKIGLWSKSSPIAPWTFRKEKRKLVH